MKILSILLLFLLASAFINPAQAKTPFNADQLRPQAEAGDTDAQVTLAEAYHDGANGIKKDDTQAVFWYRKAAEQRDIRGEFNLAIAYYNGIGIKKDLDQSVPWFLKAAEQGYPEAQYIIAAAYQNGRGGLTKDFIQSHMWLSLAEAGGVAKASSERITLESSMNDKDITAAQLMTKSWKPKEPAYLGVPKATSISGR